MAADYDVVVIGAGIHGAGIAQAAAADSYRVLLLEKTGIATATSSKSSKLIHGGLRYLESGSFSLVRESLRERELLLKLAPGLVTRQAFYIPVYPQTTRRPWLLRAGLSIYSLLAGMKKSVRFRKIPKKEWPDLDGIRTDKLQAVFRYWDAQTDDAALTRAVVESAKSLGAELVCPAAFQSAKIRKDGCTVRYERDGDSIEVSTESIVNAAGPWARDVASRISPAPECPAVDLVQGTHIELPDKLTKGCYYVEAPSDQRAVFAIPWKGHTMVGTTEHLFEGDPDNAKPLDQEVAYLLETYRHYFPNGSTELLDKWTGLRVLPSTDGSPFRRSRETQLPTDDEGKPRIVSVFGGKLTGYRATADKVLQKLRRTLPIRKPKADTAKLPLG